MAEPHPGITRDAHRRAIQPHHPDAHDNHGGTIAAWTCVGLVITGSFVMSIAVVLASVAVFIVGCGVVVTGAIAGKVLQLAGFGAPPRSAMDATPGAGP
ncbi:MAG: HGxxPAAW family protein [Angustibacter sp.]